MKSITQIQLFGQIQGVLTIDDKTAFPLTFAVSDIRDVSKKTGSYSKSIKIPGTKENNRLLNFYFDVNVQSGTFNINTLQECAVIQNGITILDNMVMQLVSVTKEQHDNNYEEQVVYTVLIKDRTSDLYTKIKNKYLTDLSNVTAITTNLTAANIVASWNNTVTDGYKFILPFYQGDANNIANKIDVTSAQPAIYAKWYFDKIFADAGYSYSWPELEANHFDRLLIPYNGDTPKTSQLDDEDFLVSVQRTTSTVSTNTIQKVKIKSFDLNSIGNSSSTRLTLPIEIQDNHNLWVNNNSYLVPNLGTISTLKIDYEFDYEVYVNNPGATAYLNYYGYQTAFEGATYLSYNIGISQEGKGFIYNSQTNGNPSEINGLVYTNHAYLNGETIVKNGTTTFTTNDSIFTPNKFLQFYENLIVTHSVNGQAKTDLWVLFKDTASASLFGNTRFDVTMNVRITGMRMRIHSMAEQLYGYGFPIRIASFIPQKIKQSDFISSVFKMYNLFTEIDKENPNKLNLKTRDDFYDQGLTLDWTDKIDKEKAQQITFLPDLHNKKLILTYKKDEADKPAQSYFDSVKEVYGQVEYEFDNEYTQGIDTQELIFGATPMGLTNFGAVTPLINGYAPNTLPKIVYDGGMYPCSSYALTQTKRSGTTEVYSSLTSYNYVGHFDKPVNPTFDLNFEQCDYYFYSTYGSLTNNNLFNKYWRRTLNLINSGKLMSCSIQLNEQDIQGLRLNAKIRIDNSWWNINKITDYDANSNDTTKVELISLDDYTNIPFKTREVTLLSDTDYRFNWPIRNLLDTIRPYNNSNWSVLTSDSSIRGMGNTINPGVFNSWITGDYNLVSDTAYIWGNDNTNYGKSSYIIGDRNIVSGENLTNIVIMGDDITATTSNTLYANNIILTSGGTINGVNVDQTVLRSTTMLLSTGAFEYSGITIQSGNTFSIGPARGYIVDTTIPTEIRVNEVIYSGQTGLTTPFLLSSPVTHFLLNTAATITMIANAPTMVQRRDNIYLGVIGHPTGFLTALSDRPDWTISTMSQMRDMFTPIKTINEDITISPNTGMTISNSAGRLFGLGIGIVANGPMNPSVRNINGATPVTFQYRSQTGATYPNTITISADTLDVGGIFGPVGGGTNSSTNQRVYILENGAIRVQPGQIVYGTLIEAIAGAEIEPFVEFAENQRLALLIGIISLKRSTTDLTNPADARFLTVSKFGETFASAAGIAIGNLQTSYNNAVQPQITTSSLLGALQVKGWDGPTNNVFQILPSTGTTPNIRMDEGGGITATSIISTSVSATTYLNLPPSTSASTIPFWTSGTGLNAVIMKNAGNAASGEYGFAAGTGCSASSTGAVAIGFQSNANGGRSVAIGKQNTAGGSGSVALGDTTTSNGQGGLSIGVSTTVQSSAPGGFASGQNSIASGNCSFVHGVFSFANHGGAIVLGDGITSISGNTTYTEKLNVKNLGTGLATITLGRDANGFIVSASTSSSSTFTGGTVPGATYFQNGLSANTISATTYLNLPIKWYAEFSAAPATAPIVTATKSIAFGTTAQARDTDMFVYGENAGNGSTGSSFSIFMGSGAGQVSNDAGNSVFIGTSAGIAAPNATQCVFIGRSAGLSANDSFSSTFLGISAGQQANNTSNSVHIGVESGQQASGSNQSVFIGMAAGRGARTAGDTVYIGNNTGRLAVGSSRSTFIGYQTGSGATNVTHSTLIGTCVTVPNATAGALNIGGVIFGRGLNVNTVVGPITGATPSGFIGINVPIPTVALEISGATRVYGGLSADTLSATTYLNLPLWTAGTGTNAIATKSSGNIASGNYSLAQGTGTTASGTASHAGGAGTIARAYGEWARSSYGPNLLSGFSQYGIIDFAGRTTGSTGTEIFIGNILNQRMLITTGEGYKVKFRGLAKNTTNGDVKEWEGTGLIKNVTGTTNMVGSTITSPFGDGGLAGTNMVFVANDTNDALQINVTGLAATNINWYATIEYIKII